MTARHNGACRCAAPRVALHIQSLRRPEWTPRSKSPFQSMPRPPRRSTARARREAAGRYLSGLLTGGRVRDVLADAIAEAKREARASGLTDEDIDAELEAWRGERKA